MNIRGILYIAVVSVIAVGLYNHFMKKNAPATTTPASGNGEEAAG